MQEGDVRKERVILRRSLSHKQYTMTESHIDKPAIYIHSNQHKEQQDHPAKRITHIEGIVSKTDAIQGGNRRLSPENTKADINLSGIAAHDLQYTLVLLALLTIETFSQL